MIYKMLSTRFLKGTDPDPNDILILLGANERRYKFWNCTKGCLVEYTSLNVDRLLQRID